MLVMRYAPKLVKAKKQASYMLQDKKQEETHLPLHEAIAQKSNSALMEEAYNPAAVEKYWNAWWEER